MPRYIVFDDSISAHCCFKASVLDTTKPEMFGHEHYKDREGRFHYESVCECFYTAQAELICAALNQMEETKGETNETKEQED